MNQLSPALIQDVREYMRSVINARLTPYAFEDFKSLMSSVTLLSVS